MTTNEPRGTSGIRGLHHSAYRCSDSEQTRRFYEDFLGLPLAAVLEIGETKTGRACQHLHTFFRLDDGSFLAFFEAPDMPYTFHDWHDFDLHIALEVSREHMMAMREKGLARGMDVRGVSDHGFIDSIYFRDPDGYVVELTTKRDDHASATDPARNGARARLDAWQAGKTAASAKRAT
jgi:catechol 2,3-dioxygenase-like lactoylglutathione lyase family enzyme